MNFLRRVLSRLRKAYARALLKRLGTLEERPAISVAKWVSSESVKGQAAEYLAVLFSFRDKTYVMLLTMEEIVGYQSRNVSFRTELETVLEEVEIHQVVKE